MTLSENEPLTQEERMLREVLDALPVAVFLSDEAGNVVFTNAAVERIWGIKALVTRHQYSEYKARWLATGNPVKPDQWAIAQALETRKPFENDLVEIDAPDGNPKILRNFAFPIFHESDLLQGVVVVTEDVTQSIHAQQHIQAAKESAERAAMELERSNQDLEQFAYAVSHDLQEPLRMVVGYLQLLSQRYQGQLDADADTFIGYAVEGGQRMVILIRDLLAYSRVNIRGEPLELMDAQESLDFALRNLDASIQAAGAAIFHDLLPKIRADKIQLAQLFQNLIGNAIKFRSTDRNLNVRISVREENGHWLFSVQDNGIGFDPQYQSKLFQVFQQLHSRSQYPGTGIGLAICKRIVERHGGRIWATGAPDQGATFFFTIPSD